MKSTADIVTNDSKYCLIDVEGEYFNEFGWEGEIILTKSYISARKFSTKKDAEFYLNLPTFLLRQHFRIVKVEFRQINITTIIER